MDHDTVFIDDPYNVLGRNPIKRWRCTHGHRWEPTSEDIGVMLSGPLWGLAVGDAIKFCALCIREKLVEAIGQVRLDD